MPEKVPQSRPARFGLGNSGLDLQLGLNEDSTAIEATLFDTEGEEIVSIEVGQVTAAAVSYALQTYAAAVSVTLGKGLKRVAASNMAARARGIQ